LAMSFISENRWFLKTDAILKSSELKKKNSAN